MQTGSLSLDQAPDIAVPLRFFLTAPLFAVAATIVWFIGGEDLLNNRWLPQSLAFTHLITLGFVTMVMIGALFQIMPVLSGKCIYQGNYASKVIHGLFTPGVIFLAGGFYFQYQPLFFLALLLLASALLLFLGLITFTIFQTDPHQPSLLGIRFAILSLWIGAAMGLWLLSAHTFDQITLMRHYTSLHIGWAALGWATTLIISISFQVIPMFQVTQNYPTFITHGLTPMLFILLAGWSIAHYAHAALWISLLLISLICILLIIFISISVHLQIQRKKRTTDASMYFWLSGLISMFASTLLFLYTQSTNKDWDTILGLIFFFGFVMAIINAMLYKIVPFLVWYNLTRKLVLSPRRKSIPLMNKIIQPARTMSQFFVHATALILTLIGAMTSKYVLYAAMTLWLLNFILLWLNLMGAVVIYRKMVSDSSVG